MLMRALSIQRMPVHPNPCLLKSRIEIDVPIFYGESLTTTFAPLLVFQIQLVFTEDAVAPSHVLDIFNHSIDIRSVEVDIDMKTKEVKAGMKKYEEDI